MKIDMHCHTKEGSIDAKVSIEKYIENLIKKGCDGMLVTDHNSYNGYRKFKKIAEQMKLEKPFSVLKGIEYDTRDGGHIIAILPDHISETFLEVRGMTVKQLEKIVHDVGGILGPAHPCGTGYFAFSNTRFGKKNMQFFKKFDFVETFNACTKPLDNLKADILATRLKMVKTAGSDAHKEHIVGSAFTEFEQNILNNNDLIKAIKSGSATKIHATVIDEVKRKRSVLIEKLGIVGYWLYNKSGAMINYRKLRNILAHRREEYAKVVRNS